MKLNITTIFMLIFVVGSLLFFFLWRSTTNSLKNTEAQLQNAQAAITSLNNDNQKLIEYITQKDNTIKELEKKYTEALDNIPADQCGDAKPSKELLSYFKKAYNQ